MKQEPILEIRDLTVRFAIPEGTVHAVNGVSLDLRPKETLGLVGESGSGKSVTVRSALGLTPPNTKECTGEVWFGGRDLMKLDPQRLREVRGRHISLVFQDPMTSLNPVFTIGAQITDALRAHDSRLSRADALERAVDLLTSVGVPQPGKRVGQYPSQFSGGMRQRAMIAMAIANKPSILIADEPTTALDVTVQAQVLELLGRAARDAEAGMLLITHDLGIVAENADRVAVMYAGRVVEVADVATIYREPAHPYFWALLASRASLAHSADRLRPIPGEPPNMLREVRGCPFRDRCTLSKGRQRCAEEVPVLRDIAPGHLSACHFAEEMPTMASTAPYSHKVTVAAYSPSGTGRADVKGSRADGKRKAVSVSGTSAGQLDAAEAVVAASPTTPEPRTGSAPLRVESLVKHYATQRWTLGRAGNIVHAVDGVSLTIAAGETLGLVGESGCGKSTVGKCVMRLEPLSDGRILYGDTDVSGWSRSKMRTVRRQTQVVFQDPYSSLNPKMSVHEAVAEPLEIHGVRQPDLDRQVSELIQSVGLDPALARRYPHEFSGGQRQRIAIARALALRPRIVVLDEPVSSLDVSAQAQVLNLLRDLRDEYALSMLFISHDLSVVGHVCDAIAVMYLGKIVETGPRDQIFDYPSHPYTQALLSAIPVPDPSRKDDRKRIVLAGEVPDPTKPPSGCRFRSRCWKAQDICTSEEPLLIVRDGIQHPVACHFPETDLPTQQISVH